MISELFCDDNDNAAMSPSHGKAYCHSSVEDVTGRRSLGPVHQQIWEILIIWSWQDLAISSNI